MRWPHLFHSRTLIFIVFAVVAVTMAVYLLHHDQHEAALPPTLPHAMKLQSSAFEDNGPIPAKYTCDGDSTIPPLEWSDVPSDAKSLALIVDDPDAPNGLWVHWLLWDIPTSTMSIAEGSVPADAVQGTGSDGKAAYAGPCPPDGEHRYQFKLYALDTELDLPTTTDKENLEEAMVGHVLDHAELVGLYEKGGK